MIFDIQKVFSIQLKSRRLLAWSSSWIVRPVPPRQFGPLLSGGWRETTVHRRNFVMVITITGYNDVEVVCNLLSYLLWAPPVLPTKDQQPLEVEWILSYQKKVYVTWMNQHTRGYLIGQISKKSSDFPFHLTNFTQVIVFKLLIAVKIVIISSGS